MKKNPELLVDADILLYRCGFAAEKKYYLVTWPHPDNRELQAEVFPYYKDAVKYIEDSTIPGHYTMWERREVEPVENALSNVKNVIESLRSKYDPSKITLFLTGKGNFRDTIPTYFEYKDNRDPSHRPKHYKAIKNYLIQSHGARVVNGMEADDAIGIAASTNTNYVIVSNDKDLDQIPGYHYDWTTDKEWYVDTVDAQRVLFTQILCGDPTDNIPGIMSERKAVELITPLSDISDMASKVIEKYEERYPEDWKDKLKIISALVTIRRNPINAS